MERMIDLIEIGLNAIGVWWVLAFGLSVGIWGAITVKIRNSHYAEVNKMLADENQYLKRRAEVEQRIHEKIQSDMVNKFGVFRQTENEFDDNEPDDDFFADDDDVIDEMPKQRIPIQDPRNPNRFIFQEV